MSNKLTWVDVAHYYLNAQPPIKFMVWLEDPRELTEIILEPNALVVVEFGLPVLRDWDSITDEEAFELLNLVGGRFAVDEVDGSAAEFKFDYASGIEDDDFEMTAPALFWFVSKGFNVFNIETWKGETK